NFDGFVQQNRFTMILSGAGSGKAQGTLSQGRSTFRGTFSNFSNGTPFSGSFIASNPNAKARTTAANGSSGSSSSATGSATPTSNTGAAIGGGSIASPGITAAGPTGDGTVNNSGVLVPGNGVVQPVTGMTAPSNGFTQPGVNIPTGSMFSTNPTPMPAIGAINGGVTSDIFSGTVN